MNFNIKKPDKKLVQFFMGLLLLVLGMPISSQASNYNPGYLQYIEFECDPAMDDFENAITALLNCSSLGECRVAQGVAYTACLRAQRQCVDSWHIYENEGISCSQLNPFPQSQI